MNDFVIVSECINEKFEKELRLCGLNVIKIRKNKNLYTAISSHADIFVCPISNIIVIEGNTYDENYDYLKDFGYKLVKSKEIKNSKYPHNVKLNLAYTGKYAIHNFKYTDENLLNIIEENSIETLNINQGYSKCSILIVDEESIITSDEGIYNSLKGKLRCLLIESGHIELKTLNYGFIGGTSGRYKDEIWFYGDVSKHPSYEYIKKFIENRCLKIRFFKNFPLEDIGSILFFESRV